MGKPAAKQGDRVVGVDVHLVQPPGAPSPIPVPLPFQGTLSGALSRNVKIEKRPAAMFGSTVRNTPPHPPLPYVKPPTNEGRVFLASFTVFINGRPAARSGDLVLTCGDPVPLPTAVVQATGTVRIGG
ncbi:PAAR domain-containing protein [Saccharothrix syringae]|uniref:PAAR motif-containing protein n=1 Tax=Saccharothrix syringae TaxID=103733 RepID=A0A5Q0GX82_SACSY|nr:PAAR domain-containing protein [Saccharothrix syringae]QFZ18657.1 hypothetical protein EKG83_15355 [Saccharothrix syringae]